MIKTISMLFLSILICSCAGSRNVKGDFEVIETGKIPKEDIPKFVDCVSHVFQDRTLGLGVDMRSRHQQRSDKYLIELVVTEKGIQLSADIYNDGRVALYDRVGFFHNNVRYEDEINGFSNCVKQFHIN